MASDDLPDGAVEHCAVSVTSYFDSEGELQYVIHTVGDAPISTFLGLLEFAKHDILVDRDMRSGP